MFQSPYDLTTVLMVVAPGAVLLFLSLVVLVKSRHRHLIGLYRFHAEISRNRARACIERIGRVRLERARVFYRRRALEHIEYVEYCEMMISYHGAMASWWRLWSARRNPARPGDIIQKMGNFPPAPTRFSGDLV